MSQDKKTIVHDLNIDDLVKIATSGKEAVIMEDLSESAKFIYHCGIRQGNHKIPAQVVYHAYKVWKGHRAKLQPKGYFFRDFSKYFERYRTKDGIHYMLDPRPFDLSEEAYWLIRSELRYEKARRQKKEK